MKKIVSSLLVFILGIGLCFPTFASADVVKESESNNTVGTANELTDFDLYIKGTLTPNDIDYFKVHQKRISTVLLMNESELLLGEAHNMSLRILDENLKEIVQVEDFFGDLNAEAVLPEGNYYIELKNLNNATINYNIEGFFFIDTPQYYGVDRYQTSIVLSQEGFENSTNVVLTTGGNFPDALSATPLAKKLDAPLILTNPKMHSLTKDLKKEITRLKAKNIYIIGGASAVPVSIEKELKNLNYKVTRVSGSNRYETSVKLAEIVGHTGEVAVAVGTNFVDALSISSVAAASGMPILLTDGKKVSTDVQSYIKDSDVSMTYVIGGKAVISDDVLRSLPESYRISGSNRYATNEAVLKRFSNRIDFTTTFVATGNNYPDALSASALAAAYNSPLILVNNVDYEEVFELTPSIQSTISQYKFQIGEFFIVGGPSAISEYTIIEMLYEWYGVES